MIIRIETFICCCCGNTESIDMVRIQEVWSGSLRFTLYMLQGLVTVQVTRLGISLIIRMWSLMIALALVQVLLSCDLILSQCGRICKFMPMFCL